MRIRLKQGRSVTYLESHYMLGTPKAISTKKQRIPWMRENGQGDKFIDEQWTISRKPNGISRVGSSETTREKLVLVALTIERLLIVERQWQIERSTTKMTDKYLLIIIEWYWFSESSRRAVLGGGLGAKLIEGGGTFVEISEQSDWRLKDW